MALSNLYSYIMFHYSLAWFGKTLHLFIWFLVQLLNKIPAYTEGKFAGVFPRAIDQKWHTFTFAEGHFQRDPPKGPPRLGKIQLQLTALQENGRTHWSGGRRRTQCCYQQWLNRGKPAARFWSLNFPRFSSHTNIDAQVSSVYWWIVPERKRSRRYIRNRGDFTRVHKLSSEDEMIFFGGKNFERGKLIEWKWSVAAPTDYPIFLKALLVW